MGRINLDDLLPMVDRFVGHWTDLNTLPGGPFESEPGYGLPALTAQRAALHTQLDSIGVLEQQLQQLHDERDGLFGVNTDPNSWYAKLLLYKPAVMLALGRHHALVGSVPNLGSVGPGSLLGIVHRFTNHWVEVNAALATPLTLGTKTVADISALHTALDAKLKTVTVLEDITLPRERAEREQLTGDVDEAHRLPTSIIAHLENYLTYVRLNFAGTPSETTLPDIFPAGGASLPRFDFNDRALGGGQHKTWHVDPSLPNAAVLVLREGAVELTQAYSATPGATVAFTWSGVTVVNGLDAMELRDATGRTIARGTFNAGLAEPA